MASEADTIGTCNLCGSDPVPIYTVQSHREKMEAKSVCEPCLRDCFLNYYVIANLRREMSGDEVFEVRTMASYLA